ncbi:MAG: hypothetical protein R3Y63_09280 [Eubacteriales bacterium]
MKKNLPTNPEGQAMIPEENPAKKTLPTWAWVLLSLVIVGAIGSAFSPDEPVNESGSPDSGAIMDIEPDQVVPQNILTSTPTQIGDVFNGFGEKMDEYIFIEVTKSDLEQITEGDYKEFVDDVVCSPAYDDYAYIRIFCDDGTGISFLTDNGYAIHYKRGFSDIFGETMDGNIADIVPQSDGSFTYEPIE